MRTNQVEHLATGQEALNLGTPRRNNLLGGLPDGFYSRQPTSCPYRKKERRTTPEYRAACSSSMHQTLKHQVRSYCLLVRVAIHQLREDGWVKPDVIHDLPEGAQFRPVPPSWLPWLPSPLPRLPRPGQPPLRADLATGGHSKHSSHPAESREWAPAEPEASHQTILSFRTSNSRLLSCDSSCTFNPVTDSSAAHTQP
jgi:hypothetical protein